MRGAENVIGFEHLFILIAWLTFSRTDKNYGVTQFVIIVVAVCTNTLIVLYGILIFYIHGSVHRDSILIRSNEMQQYAGVYLLQN